ncbi:MAG: helix-turn-helix domain-containing protein [Oscillospiraceae bacterium]|nr:helix-turn-helix domain-containing protein [Oscillospiraceae bacterium]
MSSRIFQNVVDQLAEASRMVLGVVDAEGTIISCSDSSLCGERCAEAATAISANPDRLTESEGKCFLTLKGWNPAFGYSVFVCGTGDEANAACRMAQVSLSFTKTYYEEKHDKGTFVKNIITDNILPGDIYIRAKELHFQTEMPRAVFLVRQRGRADVAVVEMLQNLYADNQQDFVISVNETDIAVVRQVSSDTTGEELSLIAKGIEDKLKTELFSRTTIGIGTIAEHLRELADSYKEAQVAIEVGKVFDTEKTVINYENLGIGRLIYQLPTTLCEIFLSEVFKKNSIESLDQETLFTINMFFENSLNVSETSRKLFVHRNTLVYRLEKIKKLTGLDLREFDDAIIFKVALMVKKYLASRDVRMY